MVAVTAAVVAAGTAAEAAVLAAAGLAAADPEVVEVARAAVVVAIRAVAATVAAGNKQCEKDGPDFPGPFLYRDAGQTQWTAPASRNRTESQRHTETTRRVTGSIKQERLP